MTARRFWRWAAGLAAAMSLALGAALFALWHWVAGADFRARVEAQATAAVGVPVTLGAIHVSVWPAPAVAVEGVRVAAPEPLTLGRVEARPDWRSVLSGTPALGALHVHDAALNEAGAGAILASLMRMAPEGLADGPSDARWLPRRVVLDEIRWTGASGATSQFDLEATLAPDGLPREATLQLTDGPHKGVQATLAPGADGARWQLRVQIGGGTIEGPVRLALPGVAQAAAPAAPRASAAPRITLNGELAIRGVDPAALTAPHRPLSGRLTADTRYSASAPSFAGLAEQFTSSTRFSVQGGRLHGLDLMRAVQTVGLSRGGETQLEALSGEITTRGRSAQVRELVVRAGALTARGQVAISPNRALSGRVTVDLAEGVTAGMVGVPLEVGGTLAAPEVTLTRGAMLGAALGTAVLPGVGTGAGARLGDRIGRGLGGLLGR